jgi:spermidine/putrescine transport system permease protein
MRARLSTTPAYLYYILMVGFLYLPIFLLIVFSFNDSVVMSFPLKGFTLKWYQALPEARELLKSVSNSIKVGLLASLISTILGTMAAIAITRFRFIGRDFFLAVGMLPLVIPYVVLGVALLILFNTLGVPLSLWTVASAHILINIPYVMLIVAARLAEFDQNIEEASMDLGASYWGTLARVTLPISAPALMAAFLSSFTTSFDEFSLAFFLTSTDNTLPVYLYSQLRFPNRLPLVITLAAIIMVVTILVLLLAEWLRHYGRPKTSPRI